MPTLPPSSGNGGTAATLSRETVLGALSQIVDEGSGRDVVSAGMITGLVIRDGNVGFAIEVDPATGAGREPLRRACHDAVLALTGVHSVTAVLTAHNEAPGTGRQQPPGGAGPNREARAQVGAKPQVPGVRTILAVASGKGGVGKSTLAVNLALGLASEGRRVGLLDADIYGPSLPRMLGLSGKPTSPDGKRLDPKRGWGLEVMSIGFLIAEDTPMIWRGPMVMSALEQMLRDVNWGELDVLVVDLPPGTGDAQLTMAQRVPITGAVIVSTPQDIALLDARKGLNMFRKVDVPVLGIVENMSYFLCPSCGERAEIFGHGGARATAAELGCDFLGEVPLHIAIRETSDSGSPITASDPDGPHAAIFREIAAGIGARLDVLAAAPAGGPRIVVE